MAPKLVFLLMLVFPVSLMAEASVVNVTQGKTSDSGKSPFSVKVEAELRSVHDDEEPQTINGMTSDFDLQLRYRLNQTLALTVGGEVSHQSVQGESETEVDSADAGVITHWQMADQKWSLKTTYSHSLNRDGDTDPLGSVNLDLKSHLPLAKDFMQSRMRFRLRHKEFVHQSMADDSELRQSRLELSPTLYHGQVAFGVKTQWGYLTRTDVALHSLETSPFVKYQGEHFEPMLKVIYRPIHKSETATETPQWQSHPVYALEMEITY